MRQIAWLDGIDGDGYRLANIFHAEMDRGGEEVRLARDAAWRPRGGSGARPEAEGEP